MGCVFAATYAYAWKASLTGSGLVWATSLPSKTGTQPSRALTEGIGVRSDVLILLAKRKMLAQDF